MSETTTPRTLYQRLCAVMADLDAVPKTGVNQGQGNYRFIESAMLMAIIRPRFAAEGIVLIPEVLSHEVHRPENSKQAYVTCTMRLTLINAEVPEDRISMQWLAEAADVGDKAVNKAITAGVKYALMKLLLISDRDEPDGDRETPDVRVPARTAPVTPQRHTNRETGEITERRDPRLLEAAELKREIARLEGRWKELDSTAVFGAAPTTLSAARAYAEQLRVEVAKLEVVLAEDRAALVGAGGGR